LQSVTDVLDRRLREIIAVGLALMLAIIVLSFWPAGLRRWVRLWPEQLAAVTGLAFWWQGFSLLGCGLLLIALLGRAVLTVRWLSRVLARRRQSPASQTISVGV
jgi:TRAP-type C4-dicarboxylate transport system permease small subunit